MHRAEDLLKNEDFWNVQARERAQEDALRRDILQISVQIDAVQRVAAIRNAPGFQDLVKSIQGLHSLDRERLVGDSRLTDAGLREMRGRVQGIESVLALLTKPLIGDQLAVQLSERKNQLAEAMKLRPQPKEPQVTP